MAISCQGNGDKESSNQSDTSTVAVVDTSLDAINKKIAEDPQNPELLHTRALLLIDLKKF
ncbi:MAG: hypothetical protein RL491_363, partial [Bacteroidota bacterium]